MHGIKTHFEASSWFYFLVAKKTAGKYGEGAKKYNKKYNEQNALRTVRGNPTCHVKHESSFQHDDLRSTFHEYETLGSLVQKNWLRSI